MTVAEVVVAVAVIVAATVAAILNHLSPELAGILGVALGYVGKAAINASPLPTNQVPVALTARLRDAFRGAPEG